MSERDLEHVEVPSLAVLADWLSGHHEQAESVWLVHFKKHHAHYVPFGHIVEELLCWGWVDSSVRGVDADRVKHLAAPRSEKSAWSAVNKEIVERMRASGRMKPAGEAKIAAARANGMWGFLDDVERLEVPDDLAAALGALREAWEAYPRSVKRGTLEWIKLAKRAPTRDKRIDDVVRSLTDGLRPTPFRR